MPILHCNLSLTLDLISTLIDVTQLLASPYKRLNLADPLLNRAVRYILCARACSLFPLVCAGTVLFKSYNQYLLTWFLMTSRWV